MPFRDLREFLKKLEAVGQLRLKILACMLPAL